MPRIGTVTLWTTIFSAIAISLAACTATGLPLSSAEDGLAGQSVADQPAESATTSAESNASDGSAAKPATDHAVELLPVEAPPANLIRSEWRTDFDKRTVAWDEILSGGPPKDGIPAVDNPIFEEIESAGTWLTERDPVIFFEQNGEAKAYPLAILIWHEIVNDEVGGTPIAVTFCPLCNASIVFDREFQGELLDFGTTGLLRNSDLIMYDRQSETWWQQFTGTGIAGEHAGRQLTFLPSQVISFGDFAAEFPDGMVLSRETGFDRRYGANPYSGYDTQDGRPFLFTGEMDNRLPPVERVVGIDLDGDVMAYPFSQLAEVGVINDEVGEMPLVVFHKPGTASALNDSTISQGVDIGAVAVYERDLGGQTLTFEANGDGTFNDVETSSRWNLLGEAIDGELSGEQLTPVISFDHFWFAWSAFFPETGLYSAEQ
ncbi:MAG: DUF3179 domain-containing protein [Caldilineaceae bacterium]|nr:DUF3179 domain-containing protein [Caldilineaceae bacterium]